MSVPHSPLRRLNLNDDAITARSSNDDEIDESADESSDDSGEKSATDKVVPQCPPPNNRVDSTALPSEVIVSTALFLDLGRDLTSYLVAIGPRQARLVRSEYLLDNEAYLLYCLGVRDLLYQKTKSESQPDEEGDDDDDSRDRATRPSCRLGMVKVHRNLEQWMEMNPKWTDRCPRIDRDVDGTNRSTVTILVKGKQARKLTFTKSLGGFVSYLGCIKKFDKKLKKYKVNLNKGDLVLKINEESVSRHTPIEEMTSMFEDDEKKFKIQFRLGERSIKSMFTSPAVATDLGLTGILRHMLEMDDVHINDRFRVVDEYLGSTINEATLLYSSLIPLNFWDSPSFTYLVTRPDIDFSSDCSAQSINQNIVHVLSSGFVNHGVEQLKTVLERAPFLINSRDNHGDTPLHSLCGSVIHISNLSKDGISRLKALLEAGADPVLENENETTPIDILNSWHDFFSAASPRRLEGVYTREELESRREHLSRMITMIEMENNDVDDDTVWTDIDDDIHASDEESTLT